MGDTVTMYNTSDIKKVITYPNIIASTKLYTSGSTIGREKEKKNQRTTRKKITRRNVIIEK